MSAPQDGGTRRKPAPTGPAAKAARRAGPEAAGPGNDPGPVAGASPAATAAAAQPSVTAAAGERPARLARVRERMQRERLDLLLVRGTDRYLNEYVPAAESLRIWLTGFSGSVGDALLSAEHGWVFVDGRYYLQADREVDPALFEVVRVPLGTSLEEAAEKKMAELARKHGAGLRVGYEPEKVSLELADRLAKALGREGAELLATPDNPVAAAWGAVPLPRPGTLEAVPDRLAGESALAKLGRLREALDRAGADAILLTRLDEIAWLTNLRSYDIDYVGSSRVDLQACKLEYSIVSPK